jgi:hypothetical protein
MPPHGDGGGPYLFPSAGLQQFVVPLQDGERRAKVMGEGGVQPFSLFHLAPQLRVAPGQRCPHGFKRRAEPSKLITAVGGDGKVQIIAGDFFGRHAQLCEGSLQLVLIEQQRGGEEAQRGIKRRRYARQGPECVNEPLIPRGQRRYIPPNIISIADALSPLIRQVVSFRRVRIGGVYAFDRELANARGGRAQRQCQRRSGGGIEDEGFAQGERAPAAL